MGIGEPMLGFAIHKNNVDFAVAEINAVVGKGKLLGDLFVVDCAYNKKFERLGLTKEIYDLGGRKQLITDLNKINQFEKRRAHLLPSGHPAMTHPRVARAMINLSCASAIFDPFCGAGGILIEARLCGVRCAGIDIDPVMVRRASANMKHFGLAASVRLGDAKMFRKKVEAVVSDLPYGLSTKITSELGELYLKFFENLRENRVKTAVVGLQDFVDYKPFVRDAGYRLDFEFVYYLHKNLSKRVVVLALR